MFAVVAFIAFFYEEEVTDFTRINNVHPYFAPNISAQKSYLFPSTKVSQQLF
jgi:hypothetical protein